MAQPTLDLMASIDAPAGSVLLVHVPVGGTPPTVHQIADLSARTGLVVLVLHGVTLEVADPEQMAAAGWFRIGKRSPLLIGAQRLVADVWRLVEARTIGSRSPAADAALDLRDTIRETVPEWEP